MCRRTFQAMSETRSRGIEIYFACSGCGVTLICCVITPTDNFPCPPVPINTRRSCRHLVRCSGVTKSGTCCFQHSGKITPKSSHTKRAIRPFLSTDDWLFQRRNPLIHRIKNGARFRDLFVAVVGCGQSIRGLRSISSRRVFHIFQNLRFSFCKAPGLEPRGFTWLAGAGKP